MNKKSLISTLLTIAVTLCSPSVWSSDAATDAETVKLQTSSTAELKALVVTSSGYKPADVAFISTAHQITITIINSKLAKGSAAEREDEATHIVSSIARAIQEKPAFAQLPVIHVDYVTQLRSKRKTIQRIDFFLTPAGAFVLHKT